MRDDPANEALTRAVTAAFEVCPTCGARRNPGMLAEQQRIEDENALRTARREKRIPIVSPEPTRKPPERPPWALPDKRGR